MKDTLSLPRGTLHYEQCTLEIGELNITSGRRDLEKVIRKPIRLLGTYAYLAAALLEALEKCRTSCGTLDYPFATWSYPCDDPSD